MRGIVDRIEDGKTAVIVIEGGGQMVIPVGQFDIEVYEGAHLDIDFRLNPEREEKMRREIKDLQKELLQRTEEQENNEEK